jgi:membrane-associated protease RseP (regulator of RpoE activity)
MFCSTCEPDPGPGPTASFVPDAQLIATSVGDDPRATVRVRATEAQGSWGLGEEIPGVGTIDRIGFVTIDVVDGTGRHATLSLLEPAQATTAIAAPAPAATTSDPYADRLKKIDDKTYEVDRSLVRELVGGSMAKAGARVSPMSKDGALTGLKVLGVRQNGLAARLGLQNGDVLEGINNTKIESANTLLGLYAQLETLNTVELEGTRRGKPLTLTLRLR